MSERLDPPVPDRPFAEPAAPHRMVVVTGLSGAGKSSILRVLEDLGYEVVDNPPLPMIEEIAARAAGPIAVGVDSRTRDFDPASLVAALARLRGRPGPQPELIYATADDAVLLRRFTATRRRHPLATHGNIAAGIVEETALTAPLRGAADIVLDTTDLPPPELRQIIEARFGLGAGGMTLSLMSFAFPAGIPREADMVFDARFLRNPHYVPDLAPRTGLEAQVADYVGEDPDYQAFFRQIEGLLRLVLPRFVAEGKKYATVAVGCSGGRHRSVTIIEALARSLGGDTSRSGPHDDALDNAKIGDDLSGAAASVARDWPIIVTHRELARQGLSAWRWVRRPHGGATPVQQRGSDPK